MTNKEELIKAKIVGLFHDPPWKPWVISNKLRKAREIILKHGILIDDKIGKRAHERQGLALAMKILNASPEEIRNIMKNYVNKCDNLSASLDRYLNVYIKKKPVPQEEKVNIVNPELKYQPKVRPSDDNISNFVHKIVEISDQFKNKDLTLLYNYLYGNIELIWYKSNNKDKNDNKALPLADTRVKTFSMFDHLYSTVSFLNWYNKETKAFEGYLVKIDIPGVQDIISRSRKIYDIWGGSWLVSALIFFTILPFIDEFGADTVLSPFMGLNPFFHTYLRSKLKNADPKLVDYDYMKDYDAIQPLMPATAFLALPKRIFKENEDEEIEEIKKKIGEYYLNAWKTIVDAVINSAEVAKEIGNELEKTENYPIVPIRVDIKKASLKITGHKSKDLLELVKGFDKLFREDFGEPELKFSYGTPSYPLINKMSTLLYKHKKENKNLYKQCTNCGILPAFIWKEKKENEVKTKVLIFDEKNENVIDTEVKEGDDDLEEGEALCYYCYLRRKLHYAKFDGVKKSAGNNKIPFELDLREKLGIVPSTIDLANLDKWKEIMESVKDKKVEGEKRPRLPKPLEEYNKYDSCKVVWYKHAIKSRFFVDKVENKQHTIEEELKECFDKIKDVNLYYALIIGDGDFVGKKVWKGVINETFEDYIRKTRKVFKENEDLFEKNLKEFAENFQKYLTDDIYKCSSNPNNEYCREDIIKRTIPITPDYLIAVSRSLMLVAIKDMEIISTYGVLVYAGGDDVVFLSPLKIPVLDPVLEKDINNTALGLVKLTRRNYWGALPDEKQVNKKKLLTLKGFAEWEDGIFDLPAVYGRSYSILVVHYKDPFYALWGFARELEKMKEYIEVKNNRYQNKRTAEQKENKDKDFTFVLRGRGTLRVEDAAILENKAKTFEALETLYDKIGKELSVSFIKDYLSAYDEFIASYSEGFNRPYDEYLDKLLDYVIERNKKVRSEKLIKELDNLRTLKSEREIRKCLRSKYDLRVEIVKAYDYLKV